MDQAAAGRPAVAHREGPAEGRVHAGARAPEDLVVLKAPAHPVPPSVPPAAGGPPPVGPKEGPEALAPEVEHASPPASTPQQQREL